MNFEVYRPRWMLAPRPAVEDENVLSPKQRKRYPQFVTNNAYQMLQYRRQDMASEKAYNETLTQRKYESYNTLCQRYSSFSHHDLVTVNCLQKLQSTKQIYLK